MPPESADQGAPGAGEIYPANTGRIFTELANYMNTDGGLVRMNAVANTVVGSIWGYIPGEYTNSLEGFYDLVGHIFPSGSPNMRFAPGSHASHGESVEMADRVVALAAVLFGADKLIQYGELDPNSSVDQALAALSQKYASHVRNGEELSPLPPLAIRDVAELGHRLSPQFLTAIDIYGAAAFEAAKEHGQTVDSDAGSRAIASKSAIITYFLLERKEEILIAAKLPTPPADFPPAQARRSLPLTETEKVTQ